MARGRGTRLAFAALLVVGSWIVGEGASWLTLHALGTSVSQLTRERMELRRASDQQAVATAIGQFVVPHPFVGFTQTPESNSAGLTALHGQPISDWGFIDSGPIVRRRSPDKLLVAITGGSFAYFFSARAAGRLAADLERSPRLAGRRVEFLRLALGGFKEPQQLMTLNYLLAAGGELDILINLDGFNEIALYPHGDAGAGASPLYPRDWSALISVVPDRQTSLATGEVALLQHRLGEWAAWFDRPVLSSLPTANMLWRFHDLALKRDLSWARQRLADATANAGRAARYSARGPSPVFAGEPAMYEELTAIWRRSSLQLARLCRANGIEYFHFLQPNVLLPGAKPLSDAERSLLARDHAPFRHMVEEGYPLLRRAGLTLIADGVAFTDLSQLYRDVDKTLYIDSCCHVSDEGYQIVARAVAEKIAVGPP